MEPDKISTIEDLTAWLVARPEASKHGDAVAIVQRTACRVFPLYASERKSSLAEEGEVTDLAILRMLLVQPFSGEVPILWASSVASDSSASATSTAARFAALAAANFVGTITVVSNAISAVEYALASASDLNSSIVADLWREIRTDAIMLINGGEPDSMPLWHDAPPSWFVRTDSNFRQQWQLQPQYLTDEEGNRLTTEDGSYLVTGDFDQVPLRDAHWSFWARWWDGILSGKQIDRKLRREIALIPDQEWEKGPELIATLIAAIELNYTVAATPNSEEIERGPDGLFFAIVRTSIRPELFRDAKEKVADTVAEIRGLSANNLNNYLAPHLARLEAVLIRYPDRPQRVHDEFEETRIAIATMLAAERLPTDTLTSRLLNQLDQGEIDIRRSDKEVAATVKARASSRLHRMKAERKRTFDGAMTAAADESRNDLKLEILEDIAATNDPSTTEEQKDEPAYRLVSRGTRMAKSVKDEFVKTADDAGKIAKGVEAAGKIMDVAPHWWDVITTTVTGWFS